MASGYAIIVPRRKFTRRNPWKICMTRRHPTLFVRLAAAVVLSSSLAGCLGGEEFQRGYLVDERAVNQVKKGMSAEQVLQTLGTPSTVSTVGNKNWYYISQVSRRTFQFLGEQVVDQRVTADYFDRNLKVERVALYGLQDGKVFDFISRSTPTGGEDLNFVGQIFRGTTKFNPFGV
jgi:outer membrane protein assembly factor BamE (lipoprotein component of BamABCDE complex)